MAPRGGDFRTKAEMHTQSKNINRGSYISTDFLLNLLIKLGRSDKMRGLPSILSLFRNEFNKFNNSGARMLDSVHHMALKLLKNRILGVKTSRFCHLLRNVIMDVITLRY